MTKQTLIATAIIVGTAFVSPIAGMAISPVREALLGLAPEDAILKVADQVDANRQKNDEELATLKTLVEDQKTTIDEQNKKLSEQADAVEAVKKEQASNVKPADVTKAVNTAVSESEKKAEEKAKAEEDAN